MVITGISLGTFALAELGWPAIRPPRSRCPCGRSALQSSSVSITSTGTNLRQSRMRATATSSAGSAGSGRCKAKRAAATSQITWPSRLQRQGCHAPTCSNEPSSSYWSLRSKVMTCRPPAGAGEEFRRHAFPVDHYSLQLPVVDCLLVTAGAGGQSHRQMRIPSIGDCKQGMASASCRTTSSRQPRIFPPSLPTGPRGTSTPLYTALRCPSM